MTGKNVAVVPQYVRLTGAAAWEMYALIPSLGIFSEAFQ